MTLKWRNRQGIALIIVLLMISLITALTLQLNREMRSEVYEAANLSDGIRLRYVAESGIYVGEAILLADRNAFDALTEPWANTEMLALQSEKFFDNASFKLVIEDETAKIVINQLVYGTAYNPPVHDLLLRLLTGPYFQLKPGKAEAILDAIKDWIDSDDEVTGNGAEGAFYAGLDKPYQVKNAPLDCIEELLMIKGITRDLYYGTAESPGLVQCLTVFGDGRINVNTARKPILRSLSEEMTDDLVNKIETYRQDERNDLGDAAWVQKLARLSGINIPLGLITTVRSETFRITAIAQQGRFSERITGVVKREADRRKVKLLSWKVQ
jgi:general secretion pathway protein K